MKTTIVLVVLGLIITGCVSKSAYKRDIAAAVKRANDACMEMYNVKDQRLKRFNQVNPDGSLR